jgi:hypothetical protein
MTPGWTFPHGLIPISPYALGGRLAYLANTFQMHKALRLFIRYVPNVPATTPGSLAFWYHNDDGQTVVPMGVTELQVGATHTAFVQTPVWESASIEVDVNDAINEYYDEESSEFRFSVQGFVKVVASGNLENQDDPAQLTFGNLYMDYEFQFEEPSLDTEISLIKQGHIAFTSQTMVPTFPFPAYIALDGASVNAAPVVANTTGLTPQEMTRYVFACSWQGPQWVEDVWKPFGQDLPTQPEASLGGAAFYMRCIPRGDPDTVLGVFFSNLLAARTVDMIANVNTSDQIMTQGMLVHSNLSYVRNGESSSIYVRGWKLPED